MSWLLRFIGWASLFALPSYFVSRPWQRALGAIATTVVGWFGIPIEMEEVQIMAPFEVGIFLAMCLASRRAPPLERRKALERGTLLVVSLEPVTVTLSVLFFFAAQSAHATTASRAAETLIEVVPWATATMVWLAMLGPHELPMLAAPAARTGPRRR